MSNKICVIAGAGPGLGLAIARRFGREAHHIVLLARREDALANYVKELKKEGMEASWFWTDFADTESIALAFEAIRQQVGQPTVLVYNAYQLTMGTPSELDLMQVTADFNVNVVGALACAQEVIPHMKKEKSGMILFTGGGMALNPYPRFASLAIGKAGLRNLTYSLASELEPYNIGVATVTISGFIQPGTRFDPDSIANSYWELHSQAVGGQEREIVYE